MEGGEGKAGKPSEIVVALFNCFVLLEVLRVWEKIAIRVGTPATATLTGKPVGISRAIRLQNGKMVGMGDGGT